MATSTTLIDRALRILVQTNSGESPTTQERTDALEALNAMLESWRNERLMCYAIRTENLTLVSGQSSYTIGPAGNLVTTRPVEILSAYVLNNNYSYDVRMINQFDYAAICAKTSSSTWPEFAYYQPSMPTGTLFVYPVPTSGSTLVLLTRTPVLALSLGETIDLPPGWKDAIAYNLAIRLAPEYQAPLSSEIVGIARETKNNIKRMNSTTIKAYTELPILVGQYRSNIITDEP
jgi:hypothetical protein